MKQGRLIVISGPSGTGKGSIIKKVMERWPAAEFSISMTTRGKREGEEHGVHYYFATREEFEATIEDGGFLEWADVFGNYYGTPKAPVEKRLAEGADIILDIDIQGAMNVRKAMPGAVLIFILPPSIKELRRRLEHRGTDAQDVIEKRLAKALTEIGTAREYDYVVVNDDLDVAAEQVLSIVQASHLEVDETIEETIRRYEEE
jgi:guanylate kinase